MPVSTCLKFVGVFEEGLGPTPSKGPVFGAHDEEKGSSIGALSVQVSVPIVSLSRPGSGSIPSRLLCQYLRTSVPKEKRVDLLENV